MRPSVAIDANGHLQVTNQFGQVNLPALWLLDNGQGPETKDQGNGQRLIDMATYAGDLSIQDMVTSDAGVQFTFDQGSSWLSWDFLGGLGAESKPPYVLFHRGDLDKLPSISFTDFMAGDEASATGGTAFLNWLQGFAAYGFGRIQGGPTESGALFKIIEQFGYVRETNYGRHFEVRTEPNPTNLAYTGLGLPPHTDNPYRDPVPTLQLLYCLENSATGGESQVVDGFAAAQALRAAHPSAFDLLTQISVPFAYSGQSGVHLQAQRPLIEVDERGQLVAVCYNTRSMQPLLPREGLDLAAFYAAYHQFGQLLNDKAFEVEFALEAGEAFLVNNRRVLHARAGFKADGHRWLQGTYADLDGLLSKCRELEAKRAPSA